MTGAVSGRNESSESDRINHDHKGIPLATRVSGRNESSESDRDDTGVMRLVDRPRVRPERIQRERPLLLVPQVLGQHAVVSGRNESSESDRIR